MVSVTGVCSCCNLTSFGSPDDPRHCRNFGFEDFTTALNWVLFCHSLQCPVQLLGGREHQPSEQRCFRCGRTMQCSSCYDSELQRTRNSPEGRLKRKHTITDAVQLWQRSAKHCAERSQGDLGRGRHLRRPTPIRLPSSEPELWTDRKGGLDRESSMGQGSAIRHQLLVPRDLALRHSADH